MVLLVESPAALPLKRKLSRSNLQRLLQWKQELDQGVVTNVEVSASGSENATESCKRVKIAPSLTKIDEPPSSNNAFANKGYGSQSKSERRAAVSNFFKRTRGTSSSEASREEQQPVSSFAKVNSMVNTSVNVGAGEVFSYGGFCASNPASTKAERQRRIAQFYESKRTIC